MKVCERHYVPLARENLVRRTIGVLCVPYPSYNAVVLLRTLQMSTQLLNNSCIDRRGSEISLTVSEIKILRFECICFGGYLYTLIQLCSRFIGRDNPSDFVFCNQTWFDMISLYKLTLSTDEYGVKLFCSPVQPIIFVTAQMNHISPTYQFKS